MRPTPPSTPTRLEHVLWIGGPPRAGKTTIATRLARRHGLRWYCSDWHTWTHRDRALAAGSAAAERWESLTPEQRRTAPAEEQLRLSLHRERGAMVLDDVRRLPSSPLIVAEGSAVPPRAGARGAWLVPTAETLRRRGASELDLLLASEIERESREHGAATLAIDELLTVDEAVTAVERRFADAIAAGPRAESREERRALLREANEAAAAQVRGYYARPWASGDAEQIRREFLCECGESECVVTVEATVADAAAPLLAAGHG